MQRSILIFIFIFILFAACFAQSNQTDWNTFTITTYYPAPYGVYRNLRLHPSDQPTGPAVSPGVMYYNQSENMIKFYNNTTWVNMTAGGGGTASEVTMGVRICNSTAEASVRYNSTSKNLEFCDGTVWQPVAPLSTGMVAGRVTVTNLYSSCYGQSCVCSAAAPGVCNGGTSGSGAAACAAITAGCKAGWSAFLQSTTSTPGNACAAPDTITKIYYCSYNG